MDYLDMIVQVATHSGSFSFGGYLIACGLPAVSDALEVGAAAVSPAQVTVIVRGVGVGVPGPMRADPLHDADIGAPGLFPCP